MSLKLATTAFHTGGLIPEKYSKDGANISPPLSWSGVPQATQSLVLIVDDPDAPSGVFVHWLLYAIPPSTPGLDERCPSTEVLSDGSRQGRNGFGEIGYGGPKPPSGVHRYYFHLFALDTELALPPGARRQDLDRAMQGHVLEQSDIFGTFAHRKPGSQAA